MLCLYRKTARPVIPESAHLKEGDVRLETFGIGMCYGCVRSVSAHKVVFYRFLAASGSGCVRGTHHLSVVYIEK